MDRNYPYFIAFAIFYVIFTLIAAYLLFRYAVRKTRDLEASFQFAGCGSVISSAIAMLLAALMLLPIWLNLPIVILIAAAGAVFIRSRFFVSRDK